MPQPAISSQPVCLQTRQPLPVAQHAGDVDLGRGLGEREVRRPQAHRQIALEERLHEAVQRRLQVGEADVLIDLQALDLMKHRRVRHVGVAAVDAPGRDQRQRRPCCAAARGSAPARCACAAAGRPSSRTCRASPAPGGRPGCSAPRSCGSRPRSRALRRPRSRHGGRCASMRSRACVIGCSPPRLLAAPRQRDIDGARGERALDARARSSALAARLDRACSASFAALMRAPAAGRSAGGSAPSAFSCSVSMPFLPEPAHAQLFERAQSPRRRDCAAAPRPVRAVEVCHGPAAR